jgi:hypothetical protein
VLRWPEMREDWSMVPLQSSWLVEWRKKQCWHAGEQEFPLKPLCAYTCNFSQSQFSSLSITYKLSQ